MLTYAQFEADYESALACFRYLGGATMLREKVDLDDFPWLFRSGQDGQTIHWSPDMPNEILALPWVWRYMTARSNTGSSYRALATKVHPDVASREGGPIIVTITSPWQDAYAVAEGGCLDRSYVAEKLSGGRASDGRLHGGDLACVTRLVGLLLGRAAA